MSRAIKHGPSHASLLRDVSATNVSPARSKLDAIVVPAGRPASALQEVITLSANLGVPLVVLCSLQAQVEHVRQRVEDTFGARALVVDVSPGYQLPFRPQTSSGDFTKASADRSSDLSTKRNIGLLLGRMLGWKKILFVDDDISQFRRAHVEKLSGFLDFRPVASMVSRDFPDNSVVCHARRLAGFKQDVFVSGAALGVNLQDPKLSFFADIYNEDWFFFAKHAAERSLPKIGEVRQAKYRPFADTRRAAREEFGDLLAEGLYALFESTPGWSFKEQLAMVMRENYWQDFKDIRLDTIVETSKALETTQLNASPMDYLTMLDAQESLEEAKKWANLITPGLCVEFIAEWQQDEARWQKFLLDLPLARTANDALAVLDLPEGVSCGYGISTTYVDAQANLEPA
ncbi:hypothetical protein AB0E69_14675 [Kribbella sp. NPDC026611]|uniref:hypothetical protein n=1 Tax=Kribbella sp. NPDC026611 TaxID=3154911 RepID=UPI0034005E6A